MSEQQMTSRERLKRLIRLIFIWGAIVFVVLAWQAYQYSGFVAWVSEWQFARMERMFPSATVVLTTLLLTLPLILLFLFQRRRHHRLYGPTPDHEKDQRELVINKNLGRATIGVVLLGLIAGIMAYFTGSPEAKRLTNINFNAEQIEEGPLEMTAHVLNNRMGSYEQITLPGKTGQMLAPVTLGPEATQLRVFLLTSADKVGPPQSERIEGYLRRHRLPGGFERLFSNSGYTIKRPTYVIFPSADAAFVPNFGLAKAIFRVALFIGLGWLLHRLWIRRRREDDLSETTPS